MDIPGPIKQLLYEKQFDIQETITNKRSIMLKGAMPSYDFPVIFKGSTSHRAHSSIMQRNHILWTHSIQKTIPADAPFHIAPILESGCISGVWDWFIAPFIEGVPLAYPGEEHAIQVAQPEELMPRIVALIRHIEKTSGRAVASIDARYGSINKKDKLHLLSTAITWAHNDTPYLAELLQLINANYQDLGTANAHGDFTETNIIINPQREPVLIDAELGDAYNYRYYDAAEFYNRLYTRALRPDLALVFLQTYLASVPKQSQQRFLNNFLCLSALRAIGNWMEITNSEHKNKQKRLTYAKRYAEDIATYKLIQL